jgi:DNA-binding phage protein
MSLSEKLKDPGHAARYLTKGLEYGDPANMQGGLLDVIRARGGYHVVAARSGLSEWRLKLMLWDEEESWKLIRLAKLLNGMGLRLVIVELKKRK